MNQVEFPVIHEYVEDGEDIARFFCSRDCRSESSLLGSTINDVGFSPGWDCNTQCCTCREYLWRVLEIGVETALGGQTNRNLLVAYKGDPIIRITGHECQSVPDILSWYAAWAGFERRHLTYGFLETLRYKPEGKDQA